MGGSKAKISDPLHGKDRSSLRASATKGQSLRLAKAAPKHFKQFSEPLPSLRDETLRDGNQGECPRSAYRGLRHIAETYPWFQRMTIGWIYTNPADKELARYLRSQCGALSRAQPPLDREKFYIYTLMHLGEEAHQRAVSRATPFGMMLEDLEQGAQPFGTVNILCKARLEDLQDFGEGFDSHKCVQKIINTARLLKEANPEISLELSLEHFFSAWRESDANKAHSIEAMVAALLHGVELLLLPDTDGAMLPETIRSVVHEAAEILYADRRLRKAGIEFQPHMFIAHMHDDLNLAAANALAALEAGCAHIDVTCGRMGERRGNLPLAHFAAALDLKERSAILQYSRNLEATLSIRLGDKEEGAEGAYNAVGGMHAHRLYKAFCGGFDPARADDPCYIRKAYRAFVLSYRGSYASVAPVDFNQTIHPTLSPVAGSSNVQLMLARLGVLIERSDPRIAEILILLKEREHALGCNFRGYNNANALLLIAEQFGLYVARHADLAIGEPHLPEFLYVSADSAALMQAQKLMSSAEVLRDSFAGLELIEARQGAIETGSLLATTDPLQPRPERIQQTVQIRFRDSRHETFQANGVGATRAAALTEALGVMAAFTDMRRTIDF